MKKRDWKRLAKQRLRDADAWIEDSRQYCKNLNFYRDIVCHIGQLFGDEARTADDGLISDSVLVMKVFPLVQRVVKIANEVDGLEKGKTLRVMSPTAQHCARLHPLVVWEGDGQCPFCKTQTNAIDGVFPNMCGEGHAEIKYSAKLFDRCPLCTALGETETLRLQLSAAFPVTGGSKFV